MTTQPSYPLEHDYPWQKPVWDRIWRAHQNTKLGHAYLILGARGSGQLEFACSMARTLLCSAPTSNDKNCGHCSNCQYMKAQTHPDCFFVTPEAGSELIKVDQVRSLLEKMTHTRIHGGYRIAIIHALDQLNLAAANSLLKFLEEPAPGTVFFLLANSLHNIPATIKSRCQILSFHSALEDSSSQAWLAKALSVPPAQAKQLILAAGGGVLLAHELGTQNFLELRERFIKDLASLEGGPQACAELAKDYLESYKDRLPLLLNTWLQINHELAIISSQGGLSWLMDCPSAQPLISRARGMPIDCLLDFSCDLQKSIEHFKSPINKQLAMENIFINWNQLFKKD